MSENPWKLVQKNLIHTNKFGYKVYNDDVITPKNKPGTYFYIDHFGYSFVVALTQDMKVAMVRQWRYPTDTEFLELPAGGLDENEDPLAAAKRELKEETGGESEKWVKLSEYWLADGVAKIKGYLYLALDTSFGKNHFDPTEKMQLEFLDFGEAVSGVLDGRFDDERTQMGLLFADKYLTSVSLPAAPTLPISEQH